jgi:hypothetical protein
MTFNPELRRKCVAFFSSSVDRFSDNFQAEIPDCLVNRWNVSTNFSRPSSRHPIGVAQRHPVLGDGMSFLARKFSFAARVDIPAINWLFRAGQNA